MRNKSLKLASAKTRARAIPNLKAPAWPVRPPPCKFAFTLNLSAEPDSSIIFSKNTTEIINPNNHTVVSEMVCYYDGVPYRTTREDFKEETRIAGDFYDFLGATKVNWFLTILFSVIAIMATVGTASVMVIILALFVLVLLILKWYVISGVVMCMILIVALIEFMKKGDEQL